MAHLGCSWEELRWSTPWFVIQRVMLDMPTYSSKPEEKVEEKPLTAETAAEIMAKFKQS